MIDRAYHTISQGWSWIVGQSEPAFFVSLAAIILAIIALSYRIRTYWLKAGEKVMKGDVGSKTTCGSTNLFKMVQYKMFLFA